jgi:pyrroloquinoline quinone biosynthesis protein B
MKVHILGGHAPYTQAALRPGTRERGVMALSDDDTGGWLAVNMSPYVAYRLGPAPGSPGLPVGPLRQVLLTDAQLDHVSGLLSLRDGAPLHLYATPAVFEALSATLPVLPVLQHYCGVHWHMVPVAGDRRSASFQVDGLPALEFTALAVDLPAPPHAPRQGGPVVGDSIALAVRDRHTGQRVVCAPGLTQLGGHALDWMREADCLLLDPPAQDALPTLQALPARHKVLLGAPPALAPALAGQGIALAYDGMCIAL